MFRNWEEPLDVLDMCTYTPLETIHSTNLQIVHLHTYVPLGNCARYSIHQKIKVLYFENGLWVFLKWGFRSLLCTYFYLFDDLGLFMHLAHLCTLLFKTCKIVHTHAHLLESFNLCIFQNCNVHLLETMHSKNIQITHLCTGPL